MIAPIGTGGMAVVYQAEHPTTHETVALKTVRVPHESQLGSIRREIHALARLSHPNIVRIVDHGIERGLPWYAMEVIRGVSLRQYVDERNARVLDRPEAAPVSDTAKLAQPLHITGMRSKDPDERPRRRIPRPGTHSLDVATLRGFLTMARRLCAPLAYLHGEGIVHGDLKPDNVIVRNTGHPVIVDFGLTVEISRETIEIAGQVIGSAAYMSPEQCKGSPLDARSDLYALGCILYELLTGRPPFLGQNVAEVLSKHLETEAMLPSEMAGGIPAALDALVMNLLTKDPRERAGYAVDVASMLVGLGAEDSVSTKMPKPRDYLYRPGLAGREEALLTFRQRLTRLTKGFGDLMLVGGESGSGKTRLSLAVAAEANRRELQVFAGECLPLPSASGSTGTSSTLLQGLGKPLRTIADRCRERGPAETKNILGARARVLALFEPSLAALPGLEDEPEPEELPPAAAQTRLFVALVDTFKAIAKGRPVIIMIDDIQWADDLTLGFLEYLVREEILLRGPLMITAAYRKEEVEGRLSRILAMSGLSHMELGKLDRTSIGQIVSDMLALPSPPDDLVAFMTERSEGNPLFVAEYLRTAVDEGLLNRNVAGGWEIAEEAGAGNFALRYAELGLPKTLQGVLARRLDALHEQARALADVASVLGRNIEGSILGAVAGVGQMDVHRNLGELVSRQILADVGNDQLRFVHDSIREVLYQRLSEERQRSLHRSVAEAMSTFYRAQRDERLAEMGHHWQHSGEPVRAQQCYLPAARRAASRYALHAAAKLYRAYLALSTRQSLQNVTVRHELGEALTVLGEIKEAMEEHRRAIEESRAIGNRALEGKSVLLLAPLYRITGRLEEATRLYEQALTIHRAIGDRGNVGRALRNLGMVYHDLGRLDDAWSLLTQALHIHREVGDVSGEGTALGGLGITAFAQGQLDQGKSLCEEALLIHRNLNDRKMEGATLGNLAGITFEMGDLAKAQELTEEALAIHRGVGDLKNEGNTLANLAVILERGGRTGDARHQFEMALAIHGRIGNQRGVAIAISNIAAIATDSREKDAVRLCQEALRAVRSVGDRRVEGRTLASLSDAYLQAGNLVEGRAALRKALAIQKETSDRANEANLLLAWSALERRSPEKAGLRFAEKATRRAEDLFKRLNSPTGLVRCACERAFLALAAGEPARELLDQAFEMAGEPPPPPLKGEPWDSLARLIRAVEAHEAGRPLLGGEVPDDIPVGLRREARTIAASS